MFEAFEFDYLGIFDYICAFKRHFLKEAYRGESKISK